MNSPLTSVLCTYRLTTASVSALTTTSSPAALPTNRCPAAAATHDAEPTSPAPSDTLGPRASAAARRAASAAARPPCTERGAFARSKQVRPLALALDGYRCRRTSVPRASPPRVPTPKTVRAEGAATACASVHGGKGRYARTYLEDVDFVHGAVDKRGDERVDEAVGLRQQVLVARGRDGAVQRHIALELAQEARHDAGGRQARCSKGSLAAAAAARRTALRPAAGRLAQARAWRIPMRGAAHPRRSARRGEWPVSSRPTDDLASTRAPKRARGLGRILRGSTNVRVCVWGLIHFESVTGPNSLRRAGPQPWGGSQALGGASGEAAAPRRTAAYIRARSSLSRLKAVPIIGHSEVGAPCALQPPGGGVGGAGLRGLRARVPPLWRWRPWLRRRRMRRRRPRRGRARRAATAPVGRRRAPSPRAAARGGTGTPTGSWTSSITSGGRSISTPTRTGASARRCGPAPCRAAREARRQAPGAVSTLQQRLGRAAGLGSRLRGRASQHLGRVALSPTRDPNPTVWARLPRQRDRVRRPGARPLAGGVLPRAAEARARARSACSAR